MENWKLDSDRLRFGALWKRVLAHLMDQFTLGIGALVCGVLAVGVVYLLRSMGATEAQGPVTSIEAQALMSTAFLVLSLPYYVLSTAMFGATLGKRILGLRVVTIQSGEYPGYWRSLLRYLGYGASGFFALGFLVALFNPKRRTLHDWVAGTVVVDDRSLRQMAGAPPEELLTHEEYWRKTALP